MEQETGSQKKTVSGYSYEELLRKLNNGEDLTEDELEDIVCEVVFESIDNSNLAMKEGKSARGLKVSFLTLTGKLCGRQTKFLPFALDYRKKAASYNEDNYDRVLDGARVEVTQENVLLLVVKFNSLEITLFCNKYRDGYRALDAEIEESISDGLGSFRGFVGMETMISMDKERENVLKLTRKRKVRR